MQSHRSKSLKSAEENKTENDRDDDHDDENVEEECVRVIDEEKEEDESLALLLFSSPSPSSPPLYQAGDKVLARDDDGLLYVAFVRRSLYGVQHQNKMGLLSTIGSAAANNEQEEEPTDTISNKPCWFYFVHYLAWKVNWDRWVCETDLLPMTDEFLGRQQRIMAAHKELQKSFQKNTKQRRIDGAEFLKAWKPTLERLLQELEPELHSTAGDTKTKNERKNSSRPPKKKAKKPDAPSLLDQHHKLRVQHHLAPPRPPAQLELLAIPVGLKRIMVEDWEVLNGPFGMVHCINQGGSCDPRGSVSIAKVLNHYLKSKGIFLPAADGTEENLTITNEEELAGVEKKRENDPSSLPEATTTTSTIESSQDDDNKEEKNRQRRQKEWTDMVKGICQLFDQALPFRLLYPSEQSQLCVILDKMSEQQRSSSSSSQTSRKGTWPLSSASLSSHYGCAHLLRLCCQLPALLVEQYQSNHNAGGDDNNDDKKDNEQEVQNFLKPILAKVNDLLRFLQKHQDEYFPQGFRKKDEAELKYEQKWIKRYERKRTAVAMATIDNEEPAVVSATAAAVTTI